MHELTMAAIETASAGLDVEDALRTACESCQICRAEMAVQIGDAAPFLVCSRCAAVAA